MSPPTHACEKSTWDMLAVTDVHTYYGGSHVLQGVSLEVASGATVAVLGRNGVGKTTLCRSIVGLTPARRGGVVFDDVEITRLPPHAICQLGLSLVPQGRRLFSSLTVAEHLAIAETRLRTSARWDRDRLFALFPRLAERRNHRGDQLSGGEQQMLAIARGLASNPTLVVMDEPTEGLSPAMVTQIAELISRLKAEGTSTLLAEQNAAFAVGVADHVYVLSQGAIVYASDPASLWADDEIKTRFLGVPA